MKILVISPTENCLTNRGKRFPDVAQQLSKSHDVQYLTSAFRHSDKTIITTQSIESLRLPYRIRFFRIGRYRENIGIRRVLWNIHFALCVYFFVRKNPCWDRLLIPNRPPEILYFLLLALDKKSYDKICVDILDIWPEAIPWRKSIDIRLFYKYNNWLNARIFKENFHSLTYVSKSFLQWYIYHSNNLNNATQRHFIPLGIAKDQVKDIANEISFDGLRFRRMSRRKLSAVFAGTISNQFDLISLLETNIDILESLDQIILVGNAHRGKYYEGLVKWLGNMKIDYKDYGEVSKAEYLKVLNSSDLALFNMQMPGLPKKIWDYALCSLPIIMPRVKERDISMSGIITIAIEEFTLDDYYRALNRTEFQSYLNLMLTDTTNNLINTIL